MTVNRWALISEIFGEALELTGDRQAEYVRGACQGDDTLHGEILRLLVAQRNSRAFVDRPVIAAGLLAQAAQGRTFRDGQLVSGRFRIVNFIGEGGMGEVYEAEDSELGAPVALKTPRAHLAGSPVFAERFRREIQLARRITHPNVCRIFDAGRHEHTLYVTMERLHGETLSRRLERDGLLPPSVALPIVLQLCGGLSAAHRAGVIHRDFKSANVVIDGPRATITDFGLARLLDPDPRQGVSTAVAIGTPAYMAPEQIEGRPVGPAADIYALGVVIYEMVTGRRPFEASSPLALAAMKVKQAPQSPRDFAPGITAAWESVILKCLAAKPEDRFTEAQQVADAMRGSPALRLRLPSPLPWKWSAAAIAVLLLVSGGFGMKSWAERSHPHAPSADALRWYRQGTGAMAEGAYLKASNLLARAVSLDDRFIAAHARLAETYGELDMGDRAKDEVIHAATLVPDRSKLPAGEALLLDAAQFTVGREFDEAMRTYKVIARDAAASDKGRAYLDLGLAAERANLAVEAVDAFRRALAFSPEREAALLHLGALSARKGDLAQAVAQLTEAEQMFRLESNFEGITEANLALARAFESSQLGTAETHSRAALDGARLTGNLQQEIKARFELSRIELLQGHADAAKVIASEAVDRAVRNHLDNLSVQGLNDVAAVFTSKLRWKEVEELSQRAIELARRSKSRGGEARALFALGQARMQLNDNDGALRYLSQAVPYYREGGYSQQLRRVLALESDVLCSQGRYAEAKQDAAEIQKWAEARNDLPTLALALQRIAEPLMFEGDYSAALALFERLMGIEKQLGRQAGTAYALINQGDMLWRLGRYSEADARLTEAGEIVVKLGEDGRGPAERLETVSAESLLSRLRLPQARVKAEAALRAVEGGTGLRVIEARAILGLALVRLGHVTAGRRKCEESLRTALEAADPAGISIARVALAEAALLARDPRAEALVKEARDQCFVYGHRELALRALLLQCNSGNGASAAAFDRESHEMEMKWGAGSLARYMQRPDIRALIPEKHDPVLVTSTHTSMRRGTNP